MTDPGKKRLSGTLRRAVELPFAIDQATLARALGQANSLDKKPKLPDQRGSARLGVDLALRLRPADRSHDGGTEGRAREVGLGGLSAELDHRPHVGERVRVEIVPAEGRPEIDLSGRISWVEPDEGAGSAGGGGGNGALARVGIAFEDHNAWAWFRALRAMLAFASASATHAAWPHA